MIDTVLSSAFTFLAFIFVLGVMIFVHEFGHFAAAKLQKIRVQTFSLGFGPRLWGFRRGDTDYRVSVLPLGGYVKMAGENYDEVTTGAPDEFLSRPKHQRFIVAVAGPVMNIALAIVLTAVVFMWGVEIPQYLKEAARVGFVQPGAPAEAAGLQPGDVVLAIDGREIPTWEDLRIAISTSANQQLTLRVQRDGQEMLVPVTPVGRGDIEYGDVGLAPYRLHPVVGGIEPGTPAAQAGLQPGDVIEQVRFGDQVVSEQSAIQRLTAQSEGQELEFTVRRGDSTVQLTVVPRKLPTPPSGEQVRVGFSFRERTLVESYGFAESFERAVAQNYQYTAITFDIIGKLLTGKTSLKVMSGPIDIAYYSGEAARLGVLPLMSLMALISLQLGVFNLLPIPILDGGVIFLLLVEGIIRRDLSVQVKEKIVQVGFVFLVLLMGFVIFNDISKRLF